MAFHMLTSHLLVWMLAVAAEGQLVPAIITFGDSTVDVGNNNHLLSIIRADFPPYGRDFVDHKPTGRFCNGKLATDFIADLLGFRNYTPPYLSPEASTADALLTGANFASGGSGLYEKTATIYNAIPLSEQLEYYKEYRHKLVHVAGKANATSIIKEAVYLLSAGSSDYLQNYYLNPLLNHLYTPAQFSDMLVRDFRRFVRVLYEFGARRIGVTSLPPLGCLPASRTLFGLGHQGCVKRLNDDASAHNMKMNNSIQAIRKKLYGLKLVFLDIYTPLLDLINHSTAQGGGFSETRRSCCGTGTIETSILCNPLSFGTCKNATSYVFWDSVHPSEAANSVLSNAILTQGIELLT